MTVKESPHEEYDRGFSNGWDACAARAQPAQAGQVHEVNGGGFVHHALLSTDEWFEFWNNCDNVDGESMFPEFLALAQDIEQAVLAKRVPMYDKTELNAFVQDLYNRKMEEGKHGHYETMFHCVHQAIKRVGIGGEKGGA